MGWPLFFTGNTYTCDAAYSYQNGECNVDRACRDNSEITINGHRSIVQEFGLVCEKANWITFSNTVFFFSLILSGLVFPFVSDLKGRKLSMLVGFLITTVALCIASGSQNIILWVVSVCFAGFGLSGIEIISLVYVSEISAKRYRNHAMVALTTMWALSQVLLGIIFSFQDYWRYIFLATMAAPYFLCLGIGYFLILETPRYLLSKGRVTDAKEVIAKICTINRRPPFKFRLFQEMELLNSITFCLKKGSRKRLRRRSTRELDKQEVEKITNMYQYNNANFIL